MGKLRVTKKSRGHYAAAKAKNSSNEDFSAVNDLEGIVLRSQKLTGATKTGPTTPEPIPEEFREEDVVPLSTKPTNKTKQVQSKKERRAEKREKWIKSTLCGVRSIRVNNFF